MYPNITQTIIRAFGVVESQFIALRDVLDCLPGDLGRYKGGDEGADLILSLDSFKYADLNDLLVWLRRQNIVHEVEQRSRWEPEATVTVYDALG